MTIGVSMSFGLRRGLMEIGGTGTLFIALALSNMALVAGSSSPPAGGTWPDNKTSSSIGNTGNANWLSKRMQTYSYCACVCVRAMMNEGYIFEYHLCNNPPITLFGGMKAKGFFGSGMATARAGQAPAIIAILTFSKVCVGIILPNGTATGRKE